MTTEIRPCQQIGVKRICFLVDLDKTRAKILDNFVWAVATKEIPIKVWKKEWKTLQLPEDKVAKILDGLAAYAIYAGMTPDAGEYLPNMVPMSQPARTVALSKGKELLERYKTQAEIEEAAEKAGKPLTGAALMSVVKRELAKVSAEDGLRGLDTPPEQLSEPGTGNTATEDGEVTQDKPAGRVARRTETKKAKQIKTLAAEVTKDLTEAEQAGENPAKIMKSRPPVERSKGFDPAKLKGSDGEYKSVSAMFKGLVLENVGKKKPLTDDQIFEKVKAKFGIDESKRGYVQWNRNWLKKEGVIA